MELTRELIIKEARRWVGYGESNCVDYLEYDSPKWRHVVSAGNKNDNYEDLT